MPKKKETDSSKLVLMSSYNDLKKDYDKELLYSKELREKVKVAYDKHHEIIREIRLDFLDRVENEKLKFILALSFCAFTNIAWIISFILFV